MLNDFNSVDLAFHEKVAETSKVKLNYMAAKHLHHIMFTHNLILKKEEEVIMPSLIFLSHSQSLNFSVSEYRVVITRW